MWNDVVRKSPLLFLISGALWSQDFDSEPAGATVARLSLALGEVSIEREDPLNSIQAARNIPLVARDRLVTRRLSKAEVQFDWAHMLRLAQDTEVRLTELDFGRYAAQIVRGTVNYRVLRDSDAEVKLSIAGALLRPVGRGIYRIWTSEGVSQITVRSGYADLLSGRGSQRLAPGSTLLVTARGTGVEIQTISEIREDDWDLWNQERDRELERSQSYSFVSPDIYGAEDLDAYGQWQNDLDYGWSWTPAVDPNWAPYRNGQWSWINSFGWSWISQDAWGWAPYHYGRWFYKDRKGWSWSPGRQNGRYRWHPALVGFFHSDDDQVGWVPLAPSERPSRVFRPSDDGDGYRNGRVFGAISRAQRSQFGRSIERSERRVTLDRARTDRGRPERSLDHSEFRSDERRDERPDRQQPTRTGSRPEGRERPEARQGGRQPSRESLSPPREAIRSGPRGAEARRGGR